MTEETISEQALDYAARSIEDFALVQQSRTWKERLEAVDVMLGSLGMDEHARAHFREWLADFGAEKDSGAVMLGLLVGLFIHQYDVDGV